MYSDGNDAVGMNCREERQGAENAYQDKEKIFSSRLQEIRRIVASFQHGNSHGLVLCADERTGSGGSQEDSARFTDA